MHHVTKEWALKAAAIAFRLNKGKVHRHDIVRKEHQKTINTDAEPCVDPVIKPLIKKVFAMPEGGKAYFPDNPYKRVRRPFNRRNRWHQRNDGNQQAVVLETLSVKSNKNLMFDMLYERIPFDFTAEDEAMLQTIEYAVDCWRFDQVAGNLKKPTRRAWHDIGWNEAVLEVACTDPMPTKAFSLAVHIPLLASRDKVRREFEKRVKNECIGFPGKKNDKVSGDLEVAVINRRSGYSYATVSGIFAPKDGSDKYLAWFYTGLGRVEGVSRGDILSIKGKVEGSKPAQNVIINEAKFTNAVITAVNGKAPPEKDDKKS